MHPIQTIRVLKIILFRQFEHRTKINRVAFCVTVTEQFFLGKHYRYLAVLSYFFGWKLIKLG